MPTEKSRSLPVRGQKCPADCLSAFSYALQAIFGQLDWLPIPDGAIHRFHVPGDRTGSLNGWYVLHSGRIASGSFGSWRVGRSHTWSSREPTDLLETLLIRQRIEQAKRQRKAEQHQRQQAAAIRALRQWRHAQCADPAHPYLVAKGVRPHGLRQVGDALLVPLTLGGALMNIQRIGPDGGKRFLSGALVKGTCSPIGLITAGQPIYLCEGWATGATLHEESGAAVACAMNCGNLLEVGRRLLHQFPDAALIIAGDDDRQTVGNPGRTAAVAAASTLACDLILPPWPADAPQNLTDFNDLRQWQEAQ